jgi:hypothetical protein
MMRNFYQTSTGRSYQYGTTGISTPGTNTVVSNQIRYPPSAVAYSQFSPLTAGIRQVCFFVGKFSQEKNFFSRTIHYLFKILIGTIKVSHHFVSIIHQCFIIQLEQCVCVCVLPFNSENIPFVYMYVPFCSMNKERKIDTKKKKREIFQFFFFSLFCL